MRPLRELWGSRLLESSGEAAVAQQRLVRLVSASLVRGKPARKIRRELEGWKKKQKGAADWCDVDTVLSLAQVRGAEELRGM